MSSCVTAQRTASKATTSTLDDDNDNQTSAGAAYVYTRSESGWSTTPAYLKSTTTVGGAAFGGSLSLTAQGNELAIGAKFDEGAPPLQGPLGCYAAHGGTKDSPDGIAAFAPTGRATTASNGLLDLFANENC